MLIPYHFVSFNQKSSCWQISPKTCTVGPLKTGNSILYRLGKSGN